VRERGHYVHCTVSYDNNESQSWPYVGVMKHRKQSKASGGVLTTAAFSRIHPVSVPALYHIRLTYFPCNVSVCHIILVCPLVLHLTRRILILCLLRGLNCAVRANNGSKRSAVLGKASSARAAIK
jgi:hypothetical protein